MPLILQIVFAAILFAIAYRGKGGGWKTWRVLSKRPEEPDFNPRHWLLRIGFPASFASSSIASHGLSAMVSAIGLCILVGSFWVILSAPLFFLFTKLDIGTGFPIFGYGADETFRADLTQERHWLLAWAFWPADKGALLIWEWSGSKQVAAWWWMTWRCGFFALPIALLVGAPWAGIARLALLGLAYVVGWAAQRILGKNKDIGVEVSEYAMGPILAVVFAPAS